MREREGLPLGAVRAAAQEHVETLRARAAALARPERERAQTGTPSVTFTLAGERYAIDARRVLQVTPLKSFTPLPNSAAPLFGLTYWRGEIVTIVDLRGPLGLSSAGVTDLSRLVVIDNGREPFAFLADAAGEVAQVDGPALRALPAEETGRRVLVVGITDDGLLVIDPEELLRLVNPGPSEPKTRGERR